jgi:hypothetical protein
MKQVSVPRAARGVRLLAMLAAAAALVAAVAAFANPGEARAQSAGLDEYRFPAGTTVHGPGRASAGAEQPAGATDAVELPGGYPLTTPVLVLGILLGAGIAAGLAVTLRRRARAR